MLEGIHHELVYVLSNFREIFQIHHCTEFKKASEHIAVAQRSISCEKSSDGVKRLKRGLLQFKVQPPRALKCSPVARGAKSRQSLAQEIFQGIPRTKTPWQPARPPICDVTLQIVGGMREYGSKALGNIRMT